MPLCGKLCVKFPHRNRASSSSSMNNHHREKKPPIRAVRRRNRISAFENPGPPTSDMPWYCQANNGYRYSNLHRRSNGYPEIGNPEEYPASDVHSHHPRSHSAHSDSGPTHVIIYRQDLRDNKTLKSLFSGSNIPGLRELALSDHISRKIYWLIAFFGLGFLCLSDIHQLLSEFYSYPITVDVRLRETRKLPFPLVTVCNLNIVRFSAICNSTHNISIPFELKQKLCGLSFMDEINNSSNSDIEDINDILSEVAKKDSGGGNSGAGSSSPSTGEAEGDEEHAPLLPDVTTQVPEGHHRLKRQIRGSSGPGSGSTRNKGKGTGKPNPSDLPGIRGLPGKGHFPGPDEGLPEEFTELTEREEKELQENLTTWLAVMNNVDKNLTTMLGHQFEDMLLRCTMKSNNCTDPRNFKKTFSPSEGNCFTYKSFQLVGRRKTMKKPVETSLAGVDHGLELVLNLEVNEYLPGSAQTGALVMVHTSEDFGTTVSEAIFVAPERTTYIGMKMVKITRLPSPFPEHCVDSWPEGMVSSHIDKGSYSQQVCLKICLQQTIERNCKCQSATLPQLELNSTDLRFCDTRRRGMYFDKGIHNHNHNVLLTATRLCVEKVIFSPENKIEGCDCPPRCQVVQYEKTISLAKWPTREDRVTFDSGKTNVNIQNVAKVVVYFQTMTSQEVTQQSAWTTAKLFSSLGGFMGMYVGFSFLSLFEILEALLRRLWSACTRKRVSFKATARAIAATLKIKKHVRC